MPKPDRVREPVQVYLDKRDRELLDRVAERAALPRAEVLRVALRRMAADLPKTERPGWSLASLTGALDAVPGIPTDLSERHDEYLYGADHPKRRQRKR